MFESFVLRKYLRKKIQEMHIECALGVYIKKNTCNYCNIIINDVDGVETT